VFSVGILVFDNVGILDFSAPYAVFSTATRIPASEHGSFRCFLIAAEMRAIRVRGGLKIPPDCVLLPSAELDVLIIPGGDVSNAAGDPALIDWIHMQARDAIAPHYARARTADAVRARHGARRGTGRLQLHAAAAACLEAI
jgi:transcriptional regulator GlxA family with amidase domain